MTSSPTTLIIGAGLGGLATAIALASSGHRVRLFEKNPFVGGKLSWREANGYTFDLGPSLLTLPDVFRDLFALAGADFDSAVPVERLPTLCRYQFADGSWLDIPDGIEAQIDAIHAFNPAQADAYRRFMRYAREVYEAASKPFMYRPFGDVSGFGGPEGRAMLRQLPRILSPRSLHGLLRTFFHDPRLVQLFGRFATYNGSSPYRAPATFAIIAHVEHELGAYSVPGGLYRIAEAELELARTLGVEIQLNRLVTSIEIENRRATGIRLEDGEFIPADAVVVNADAATAYERLLPAGTDPFTRRRLTRGEPSTSAFVMLAGIGRRLPALDHHNVFFSADYRREFDDIFARRIPPRDPTVYVCASSRTDASQAPEGCESLFVMVNMAALAGPEDRRAVIDALRPGILDRLDKAGIHLAESDFAHESYLTPSDFAARYASRDGSLYGPSSNTRIQAFWRAQNRAPRIGGLFFAGGGAHPGGGMPLVTLSGLIVTSLVKRYLAGGSR